MVANITVFIFCLIVRLAAFSGGLPLQCNPKSKIGSYISRSKSSWMTFKYWMFLIYTHLNCLYLALRSYHEMTKKEDFGEVSFLVGYTLANVISIVIAHCFLWKGDELIVCTNAAIVTTKRLRAMYMKKENIDDQNQRISIIDQMMLHCIGTAITFPVFLASIMVAIPELKIYMTSLFDESDLSTPIMAILTILYWWCQFAQFSSGLVYVAFGFLIAPQSKLYLDEITYYRESYKMKDEFRSLRNIRNIYMTEVILVYIANDFVAPLFLMIQFIFKREIYIYSFIIIVQRKNVSQLVLIAGIIWVVLLVVGWVIILKLGSLIFDSSNACIKSWEHPPSSALTNVSDTERKAFSKFVKSCPKCKIRIGSYTFLHNRKIITFLYSLSVGTTETNITFA